MNAHAIFPIANMLALIGWLLLVIVPRKSWTPWVSSVLIMLLLGILYTFMLLTSFGATEGGFGSLEEVRLLFQDDRALLAGWVHYLAFDLFLGSWITKDAQKHRIAHWMILPCLFFTFMAGPVGVLLYYVIRLAKTKDWMPQNFSHA
jgi:hypothetical protein